MTFIIMTTLITIKIDDVTENNITLVNATLHTFLTTVTKKVIYK
jgi:hypothetical protein